MTPYYANILVGYNTKKYFIRVFDYRNRHKSRKYIFNMPIEINRVMLESTRRVYVYSII
jgi:hypothetical protein